MTAVAWPASLPTRFLQSGYSETPGENVLREEMDVGPNKTRRRATVAPVRVTASMVLSLAQFSIWDEFYTDVLFHGTVAFAMPSVDGTIREMFVVEPPSYASVERYIQVTLVCEYIP